MVMELLSAKQARQISEENTANNTFVKRNLECILEKIVEEANKGEYHIYIYEVEIAGNKTIEKMTIEQIQKLGYSVYHSGDLYKISW
jgi:hypothetical protein